MNPARSVNSTAAAGTTRVCRASRAANSKIDGNRWLIEAIPFTGRTHQIRLHARDAGFSILGDETYGGSAYARLCLHAHVLEFVHPLTRQPVRFEALIDFEADPHVRLRQTLWPERRSP